MAQPTAYKISTITATGSINANVNLPLFYKYIRIIDHNDMNNKDDGYMYIEYGRKKAETFCKGFHRKMTVTRRKKQEGKRFDNQATIILRNFNKEKDLFTCANLKIFRNGNVQMTGIKYPEQGLWALQYVINSIKQMAADAKANEEEEEVVDNIEGMDATNYKIRLINSDFRIGFDIKRDRLCKILQQEYGVISSYEPCIYPGVKIQYFWNTMHDTQTGVCKCTCDCDGKGSGCGMGNCQRITIAVFQSGCIIITGAQTCEQIDTAYKFICDMCIKNRDRIEKQNVLPVLPSAPKTTRKKVAIPKCNIRVPDGYILEQS